jgi:lactate 2-monooxygenase
MLRPVTPKRNLTTTLFNTTLPAPLVMAPIGVQTLFHPQGEHATSAAFGSLGLPYVLSTATSTGFADVAAANGLNSPRWYQLYWPSDPDLTRSYLTTAKAHGFTALEVTVDTWDLGWRTRDLDRGFFPFIKGVGVQIGLEDPVAHEKLGFDATAANATAEERQMAALYHVVTTSRGVSPVWENLAMLREIWGDGPILLKGIQKREDAEMAVRCGMDGVVVSNVSLASYPCPASSMSGKPY